ncbi:hypothetical protein [Blastococcus sp. SYSU D00813]
MATDDGPRGTWRRSDGTPVPFSEAKPAWIAAAREELVATAGRYGAYVTYGQLAERVFEVTDIETGMQLRNLMPQILGPLAEDGHQRGEPPLTALCVRQTEEVGAGYEYVPKLYGEEVPEDLDLHAAEARLRCYEYFGAELPPDGGRPALTERLAASRRREAERKPRPVAICPSCYMQLPPSGRCGNCVA